MSYHMFAGREVLLGISSGHAWREVSCRGQLFEHIFPRVIYKSCMSYHMFPVCELLLDNSSAHVRRGVIYRVYSTRQHSIFWGFKNFNLDLWSKSKNVAIFNTEISVGHALPHI